MTITKVTCLCGETVDVVRGVHVAPHKARVDLKAFAADGTPIAHAYVMVQCDVGNAVVKLKEKP